MQTLKVKTSDSGKRADVFVSEQLTDYSRASLKRLFELSHVKVNNEPAKAGQKLRPDDNVKIDTSLIAARLKSIELPVLYEDDDVIVIDKPAGVLTHSKGALNLEPTVASFIAGKITDKKLSGNRAGIVHRLDRATSGVIIGAKTEPALNWLQKQFSTRRTVKTYLAIVEDLPKPQRAVIDVPIIRNPKKPQTFKAGQQGKPAQTQYKVLKNFQKAKKTYSLVELNPLTGRTHQIRVHLSYIGHPVVGDIVYGKGGKEMMLHAWKLELTLPGGQKRTFEAPLPSHFKHFYDP